MTPSAMPRSRPAATQGPGHAGELLAQWRRRRRRSQMDLSLEAGVSTRHLSFIETGRSTPSRTVLLALAEELEVPLRERNALLLAAGYAPAYAHHDLDSVEAGAAREALVHLLAGHEPYPAVVLDRWGDVVLANAAMGELLVGVDPDLLTPAVNVYRVSLHPQGLSTRISNRDQWTAHLGHRLARLVRLTADQRLVELLEEVRSYPGVAAVLDGHQEGPSRELLLTLELAHPTGALRLHSTTTSFGSPNDVTLADLAVESFFPADPDTRARLHDMERARGVVRGEA